MTREEILGLLADLADAYPRQTLRPGSLQAYAAALSDLPEAALREASRRHVATSTFFPSIAELRAAATAVASPFPGWEEAWSEVNATIRRYGSYGVPNFPEPGYSSPTWSSEPLRRAVEAMGYRELCSSDNDAADRAHFRSIYEAFVARARQPILLGVAPAQIRPALAEAR